MERVVVTGGAGFIGGNLCRALAARGAEVLAVDDLSTGTADNLAGTSVDLRVASILDPAALDDALAGAGAVVHLAARPSVPRSIADPVAAHTVNATGTLEVLEAARRSGAASGRLPQVIVASSSSVYGSNPALPKHEDLAPRPRSPYAASKLATESYALAWAASYDLPVLAFRFFNVFGPLQPAGHDYAAVVPAFLEAALAGRPLPVHGDGSQSRDFTYVGSVVAVLVDAIERRVTDDGPVNLAFGTRTDLRTLISLLEQVVGEPLAVDHQPRRPGDVDHSQADVTRLRHLFPDVEPVPLEDGLRRTADWFRTGAVALDAPGAS